MFGGMRRGFEYLVQLQLESGEVERRPYAVYWDPAKVSAGDVAEVCAAELRAAGLPCAGVAAVLQS